MEYDVGDLVVYTYKSGTVYYGIVVHVSADSPQWFSVRWNDGSVTMEHKQYAWIRNVTKQLS
jgi:hypothetical protein|tara:strand:- start:948 stop:1133 length:186 start_codon:yes stop_codon:yes gene_type:complete